ncbi:hypothetical protein PUN28_017610 [Cardiocondyla obscurior]|uniref:Uncharacterized protein n=1 Tax=Cardiocondyla obscurior TaxID=286306 RepID=A0AAW2EJV4_9HYME
MGSFSDIKFQQLAVSKAYRNTRPQNGLRKSPIIFHPHKYIHCAYNNTFTHIYTQIFLIKNLNSNCSLLKLFYLRRKGLLY